MFIADLFVYDTYFAPTFTLHSSSLDSSKGEVFDIKIKTVLKEEDASDLEVEELDLIKETLSPEVVKVRTVMYLR